MPVPVNKKKLDKNIADNILLNNGAQFITAQRLQDTLYPIVNSTFGLKTIWAGWIHTGFNASGVRDINNYYENYYDPNYFPPVQDTSSVVLNSILNKYQVTSIGSGLRVNNLANGTFTNVRAILATTNNVYSKYGTGLTFDGEITSGQLTSLTVNNPGMFYRDGAGVDTRLQLELDQIGSGSPAIIKFNMTNTIWPSSNNGTNTNGWRVSNNNVFIPNISNSIASSIYLNNIPGVHMAYNDNYGAGVSPENSNSRVGFAASAASTTCITGGALRPGLPGFAFDHVVDVVTSTITEGQGYLEIKVPIINTTI